MKSRCSASVVSRRAKVYLNYLITYQSKLNHKFSVQKIKIAYKKVRAYCCCRPLALLSGHFDSARQS